MALSIGLHSQTFKSGSGGVAGSEITTNGLSHAFAKLKERVVSVYRFAPGNYQALNDQHLDLLIVEGWHISVPTFIKRIRKQSPQTKIIFWNLSFYGFNEVVKLDVDGFLCNSLKVKSLISKIKPTKFLMLAADTDFFKPLKPVDRYRHKVVYLGMNHKSKSSEVQDRILGEAAKYGLAIYGAGWGDNDYLKPYWKGLLPSEDIPLLYSSAKAVLGITEDRQLKAGMINNRVFEALACGASFISDYSSEMERVFGNKIYYSKRLGDTTRFLDQILNRYADSDNRKTECSTFISENHNYDHRVAQILDFYDSI